MSYPFGSGMPYPSSNSAPYPPQSNNAPPYPTQSNLPYPPQSTNYSQYPSQMPSAPFGTGDGYSPYQQQQSNYMPYPTSGGGVGGHGMPGYPQQQQQQYGGYPGHNQYPPSNAPPFGSGFCNVPGAAPAQHHSSPYPPPNQHNPSAMPPNSHLPYPNSSHNNNNSSSGYTSGGGGSTHHRGGGGGGSGYGAVATNMANCFSEMQSHIKDTRKENKSKGTPTLISLPNFDPIADAKALRKAMKGFGTDEDALINVICRRNNEQRQIIQREYKTNFGKDLIEDIKSETTGNFENLLVALLTPIVNFYVKELHDAMAGIGTDEDVLVEILCSMTNYEIHTIKNAYERLYGKNLESELMSETSGNFKRLLVSLCTAARDESGATNIEAARRDATELLNAGELRVGTDESTFNMVLCQRNYAQIKLICEEYERMTGHSLEKAIKREFSGDIMDGLIAIIQCTSNKSAFFASRLHKSMAGIGTNDNQLIRLIVTRCEIDLADIKATFESMYGKSLKSWIKGDTSGHYKHALYALIGEQRSS